MNVISPKQATNNKKPKREFQDWAPAAAAAIGVVTLAYFMMITIMFRQGLPEAVKFPLVSVLALGTALSSAFLGGSAAAKGSLPVPFFKDKPIQFSVVGGISVFVIVFILANWLYPTASTSKNEPGIPTGEIVTKPNSRDNLTYVRIPPGSFIMGCSQNDNDCDTNEMPPHPVAITEGFWLGQTVVTQAAYQHIMGRAPRFPKGDQRPVDNVTWFDARDYCNKVGMRLPTEAEWEYAARAGIQDLPRYGDVDSIAWYQDNSGRHTHEVMTKRSNSWQLYDMLGNVWQWTADWYDHNYYRQFSLTEAAADPQGPTSSPNYYRTLRGGGCFTLQTEVRFSSRYKTRPEQHGDDVGFRCAGKQLP